MELYHLGVDVLTNPKHSRWVSNVIVAGEAALCALIILKVPYTEIDWTTYMQQVSMFVNGERNYALIKGDTGPLVYPSLHVYLYTILYYLTEHGTNIFRAQCMFALLYLITLAFVLACYRRVGAPPWLLVPLALSKRLHSIFLLRLFNDAWAALLLWSTIWLMQKRYIQVAAVVFGIGVGIKMTLLLAAPAVAIISIQAVGLGESIFVGAYVAMIQGAMAMPFLHPETGFDYFFRAFDFGRQFLHKWTVNWRFIGEDVFVSRSFAASLMITHVSILAQFLRTRWIKPSGASSFLGFAKKFSRSMSEAEEDRISAQVKPLYVTDTMLTSVVIGLLCARSLHYQFYAYLGWATPYLLWRSGLHPVLVLSGWAAQEYAWLVYPSTNSSSAVVVSLLIVQVSGMAARAVDADAKSEGKVGKSAKTEKIQAST